ncbi:MAG TPA: N-6 DNA methylase [Vicinamibacterales bacterium]|nr:N-6 DNA methylase [Vicinamibacterales bacterium]
MIAGVRGRLITASFARDVLPSMPDAAPVPRAVTRALASWSQRLEMMLGTASSVRAITDVAVMPLLSLLELSVASRAETDEACTLRVIAGRSELVAHVVGWSEPMERVWRSSIVQAIASDVRWCLCCNGRALRLVDARRAWSREYLEFDLALLGREPEAQSLLWTLVHADAMASAPPLLDRAVDLSSRHGVQVCQALGTGVLHALELLLVALGTRRGRPPLPVLFEQSLTVLYRVLFLLFAEARGLVPLWHPVYRDRYSLDTIVSALLNGERYRGLWQAVQAISRLAHAGCTAGELTVTAFNGRLFAPSQADAFERTRISDTVMGDALVSVSTTPVTRQGGRARIVYRDLDVEQLGAVYERVLDYEPASGHGEGLTRTRDVRKSSGTFYTPRLVTAFLVRRTLEPLVRGRRADEILALRILDPAMGSGAFLVAACRYLSASIEEALIAEGRWHAHDVTPIDRAALRRDVASRCLFGVDLNPMAVQLARLSLWLATLASDKPLSFLDHHLVTGNSLVGATPADLGRQPSGGAGRTRRHEELPLFEREDLSRVFEHAVRVRLQVTSEPDDSAAIVREKERTLAHLHGRGSSLGTWSRVLDLWCAGWFWKGGPAPDRGTFRELVARLLEGRSPLPEHISSSFLTASEAIAGRSRFHHWPLAFPEVFVDERGEALSAPGFDAVIGNPPWDMVRGDSGGGDAREDRRQDARQLTDFVRESGIYRVESRAHANLYQLFVERALQLVRPGGRIGLVLPSGVACDAGAAPLRRHLFDRADVEEIAGLDNRDLIFPIHRSSRFVLLTCSAGRPTSSIACRFGITRAEDLERGDAHGRDQVTLTRAFLTRLSGGDDLGIPEVPSRLDLSLVERISADVPRLGSDEGWAVQFGRELNASDDRDSFIARTGSPDARPIVEGKQIDPFRVSLDRCRLELARGACVRRSLPRRARLAYRDVASATNRLTLIAAIIPARAVTTHTLFCLKTKLPLADQQVLCALLNSFVANYLIRLRVNTHVTVTLVSRLPVPLVRPGNRFFERLRALSATLTDATASIEQMPEYAELQAIAARLYGLTASDFEHVVGTFPLIAASTKQEALAAFKELR